MSKTCQDFGGVAPDSIANGLRAIDCLSGQAIEVAFSRFFGPNGALGSVLTLLLTLYVAFIALRLLTGRGESMASLTPRMLGLGLALTFATSWVAYQTVALNLTLAAPDYLATILAGSKGSATELFATRLDSIFNAMTSAAAQIPPPQPGTVPQSNAPATAAGFLWGSSIMLLLSTVGVLLVSKIALVAMLALGPLFIILALFPATRGLFEGWLKAVVMFALTPLFAVLLGSGTLALIGPMVDGLDASGATPDMRLAVTIFLAACVHVVLMAMALKATTTIVTGWRLPFLSKDISSRNEEQYVAHSEPLTATALNANTTPIVEKTLSPSNERVQSVISSIRPTSDHAVSANYTPSHWATQPPISSLDNGTSTLTGSADLRSRGIGQQFRSPQSGVEKTVSTQ